MIHTKDFLSHAIKLVGGDRQKDYGDKVENLMSLLKVARTKLGAVSKDTYVDMSAYSAIAGEIKFKEK